MGGGANISSPVIAGLQIQTSTYGLPIPIVWGQQRIQANLLWFADFKAIPHTKSSGGKGGGGVSQTTYSYQAAGYLGLCEGPINGVASVWAGKNLTTLALLGLTFVAGSYPQGIWGYLTTNHAGQAIGYSGVASVYSSAYLLTDTAQLPNHSFEIRGKYQYGSAGQTPKTCTFVGSDSPTINSTAHGFTQNQVVRIASTGTYPTYNNGYHIYTAVDPNADYYINNPTANTFQLSLSIRPSPLTPVASMTFHTAGSGSISATLRITGANPKDIVTDFLTNPIYGVDAAFPIDSFASFSDYCIANGFFLSPALTGQIQASDFVSKVCEICNSAPVWSDGMLKIIPYGDTPVTGNGITFTPNTTPQYDLSDDDFISDGTVDPIQVTRGTPADAFNQVQVQFKDRVNQYNQNITEAKDQSNIDLYGLRPVQPLNYDYITDGIVARSVAQVLLQRVLYLRNQFTFKVSWKYARLEPMDLVTITDLAIGLDHHVVRIIDIEEDEDEQLTIIAEDYLDNNATATAYPTQDAGGWTSTYNADPGVCNTPIIFDAPGALTALGYELWIATSGASSEWGGCQVWVSTDDITYKQVGSMYGPSRYGSLSANVAAGSDPDTTDTFSVDLSISKGVISSGSTSDADAHNTLALVAGEVISFSTATLTGANAYNLTTYTRRGIFNTVNGAHVIGDQFIRLDDGLFKYPYDKSLIGSTIYIKLLPFNQHIAGLYSLSDVTGVPYAIQGPMGYPNDVTQFAVQQSGEVVSFSWNLVPDAYTDIAYAPVGTADWSLFSMLTEAARGTEMTNAEVPPGAWAFGIRARDISNKLSRNITLQNFTVKSFNINIIHDVEKVGWSGTLVGLQEHYAGMLIPDNNQVGNFYTGGTYTGWEWIDDWVIDPVSYIEYTTPQQDAGYDEQLRVYDVLGLSLGYGQSGVPSMNTFIDTWLTGNPDPAIYTPWVIGTLTMRYIKGRISASIAQGSLFMITDYTLNVDMSPVIESPPTDITITAPNSTVTYFPTPFHYAPFVVPQVKSGAGTSATATSFHQNAQGQWDGVVFKIWQGATEVSGTLTYTATGE